MASARFDYDNIFTSCNTAVVLHADASQLMKRTRRRAGRTTVTANDMASVSGKVGGLTFGRWQKTNVTFEEML